MNKIGLDTPCLVLDLDILERNIREMAEVAHSAGVFLRPMTKTHKCPLIAHLQLKAPATPGINVTKVREAEVMALAGVRDIFVSNEIVGESKLEKLVNLAKNCKISTSVDSLIGARGLNDIAGRHDVKLDVLVNVDTGMKRTGVPTGKPTLELVQEVLKFNNLNLKGIWTHEGHNYVLNREKMLRITVKAGEDIVRTKDLIERETGIKVYCSVGSTPGAKAMARLSGVDEIRPGVYIFNDASMVSMGVCDLKDCACAVLATVISTPEPNRFVCDAGMKGYYPPFDTGPFFFTDKGFESGWQMPSTGGGIIRGLDGEVYDEMVFHKWHEEYGLINVYGKKREIKVGDKIEIIPWHVCDTVNLHDEIFGLRNGKVETLWPISGRGPGR